MPGSPLDELGPPTHYPEPFREPPPPKVPETDWFGESIPMPTGGVFIIDRSGSMAAHPGGRHGQQVPGPTRLEQVIAETGRMLAALPPNASFDLVEYSTDSSPLWGLPRPANESNKAAARAWLAALYPSGGTNTGEHTAWALVHTGYRDVGDFFLLSDGIPRGPKQALEMIGYADTPRTKVHAFAFVENNVPAEKFMSDVAVITGGTYRQVLP
jgi:hypothetical protein